MRILTVKWEGDTVGEVERKWIVNELEACEKEPGLILKVMGSIEGFLFVFNLNKMGSVLHFRKMTLVACKAFRLDAGRLVARKPVKKHLLISGR